MKLLLDEHLSLVVAEQLRGRGHDVVCVAELPEVRGLDDPSLLSYARAQARVLVSADRGSMPAAVEVVHAAGGRHAGVVLVARERFTLSRRNPGPLIAALAHLIETRDPVDLVDAVLWL